jgi:hypothetical protein
VVDYESLDGVLCGFGDNGGRCCAGGWDVTVLIWVLFALSLGRRVLLSDWLHHVQHISFRGERHNVTKRLEWSGAKRRSQIPTGRGWR